MPRVRGSTPARAEIWIEFSAPCAPLFRLWNHNIRYQSQSHTWKLTYKGRPNGWRYVGRKEETRLKSDGRKSEWITSSMEGEGKDDGHQYRRKPRTPEPIPVAGKLT